MKAKKSIVLNYFLILVLLLSLVVQPFPFSRLTAQSHAGEGEWFSMGSLAGTDNTVWATVMDNTGNLYAGGEFVAAGRVAASRVAKWDGSAWSNLGTGLNEAVRALALDGSGNLYAGGDFTTAGGASASRVAKWDGSAWSNLGTGMNGTVYALAFDGERNLLYAGGAFTTAGGTTVNRVAKWNGSNWSELGQGLNGTVHSLALDGEGNLYAGGSFTFAGETAVSRVAKWDGTAWSPLGTGINNNTVYSLVFGAGSLYAGGDFTLAGGASANRLAKWNGEVWSPLGTGSTSSHLVYSLALDSSGNLYAGCGNQVRKWVDGTWSTFGTMTRGTTGPGLAASVRTLTPDSAGNIFAGGYFYLANGVVASMVARWDDYDSEWSPLGAATGINNGRVNALVSDSAGNLFAGGSFTLAGGMPADGVARWDGAWSPVGTGINGEVYALAVGNEGELYAGGNFPGYIAKWDGAIWNPMIPGTFFANYYARALVVDGEDNLYAGGLFYSDEVHALKKWNGTDWSIPGEGVPMTIVRALALDRSGNLYAGGSFTTAGWNVVGRVAKWDGEAWSVLGGSLSNLVNALAVDADDNVYAGCGTGIYKWNGESWSLLPGAPPSVNSLVFDSNNNLYAGGSFTSSGGVQSRRVSRWDGSTWSALREGMDKTVHALTIGTVDGNLYAGGEFICVGSNASPYVAMFGLSGAEPVVDLEEGISHSAAYSQGTVRQYYRLNIPSGKNLRLTISASDGGLATYLRYGALPVPSSGGYDHQVQGGELIIPQAAAGDWYVLVHGEVSAGGGYLIMYETVSGLFLTGASPVRHVAGHDLELTVEGGGFAAPVNVELVRSGGTAIPAGSVTVHRQALLTAQFPAGTLPAGRYGIRVSRGGESAVLADALDVVDSGGPRLEARLIVPAIIGIRGRTVVCVEYANTGDMSMPAPLLAVTAVRGGLQLANLTLDKNLVGQGALIAGTPKGFARSVQFLASGNTPGILHPGEIRRVNVYYVGWQGNAGRIQWKLGVLTADNDNPVDWSTRKEEMLPDFVSVEAWEQVFDNFVPQAGSTWGDFLAMLSRNAVYLHRQGQRVEDIGQLVAFSFRQADSFHPLSTLVSSTDALAEAPGMSIFFEKIYLQAISRRHETGPLGRGWRHNWQISLERRAGGSMVVIKDIRGNMRFFQSSILDGSYLAQPGDLGKLTSLPGGGFRLREKNGRVLVFHADGKLHYVEDPTGNRITCMYDAGLLTRLEHSSGQWLEIAYNGSGRISSVSDMHGRQVEYYYSGDYLSRVKVYGDDNKSVSFTYNTDQGSAACHALIGINRPNGPGTTFGYDGRGRLESFYHDGSGQFTYTYDDAGTVSATDPLGNTSKFFFDYNGRMVKTEDPFGGIIQYSFDELGNMAGLSGPAGYLETYGYDRRGNLNSVTDPLDNTSRFTYCSNYNQPVSITDANGNRFSLTYDTVGNISAVTYPDNSRESWIYHRQDNSQAITWTNRRGETVTYAYDNSGRLTGKSFDGGTTFAAEYTYDDERGNLIEASNEYGTVKFEYNGYDLLTRIEYPGGRWLSFSYDEAGRRTTCTDQSGHRQNYYYDGAGRLERVTEAEESNPETDVAVYQYDSTGRLWRKTLGNGVYTVYGYDAAGRVVSLVNHDPEGQEISRFGYTYDSRGNRAQADTHYGGWTYHYDNGGQLTGAELTPETGSVQSEKLVFHYDAPGNRIATVINGEHEAYDVNNLNQYSRAGSRTYTYDADGNLVEEHIPGGDTTYYAYDRESRLTNVRRGYDTWEFRYDALGNRIAVSEYVYGVSSERQYVYDPIGLGNLVGEYDANGLIARYTHGLGLLSRFAPAGGLHFYSFDGSGNTSELTGTDGSVSNAYAYRPFGELILHEEEVTNPFQYVGEMGVMADASGLYHMRNRYYGPYLGRFTATDPIRIAAGDLNLYRYVHNSPVDMVDPTGLRSVCTIGAGAYNMYSGGMKVYFGGKLLALGVAGAAPTKGASLALSALGGYIGYSGVKDVVKGYENVRNGLKGDNPTTLGEQVGSLFQTDSMFNFFQNQPIGPPTMHNPGSVGGWANALGKDVAIRAGIGTFCAWEHMKFEPVPEMFYWFALYDQDNYYSDIVESFDPNSKTTVAGYGPQNFVLGGSLLVYRVDFENLKEATAPAWMVKIEDPLSEHLEWSTFELAHIGFGDIFIAVPPGQEKEFETVVDYTHIATDNTETELEVHIRAWLEEGTLKVTFFSWYTDPDGELTVPPAGVGFLPPEDDTGRGQGQVAYFIRPKANLPSGTEIRNIATIWFDDNAPIYTNQIDPLDPTKGTSPDLEALVTIDAAPPTSTVDALPAVTVAATFPVSWSGEDDTGGSGIAVYDVYVRKDGGPWVLWLNETASQSEYFTGENNRTYSFYCIAADNVGHREVKAPQEEASTTVSVTGSTSEWDGEIHKPKPPAAAPKKTAITLTIGLNKARADDKDMTLDAAPFLKPRVNRTMVPVRFISELLGAKVSWHPVTRQVKIEYGTTEIILTVGSGKALLSGKEVELDCPAEIINGRTFVPLRFVSEGLGATVHWDRVTRTIIIEK